ncbi:MAG TPA: EAL domain-containing response regulator [Burkholderiales bacterium]|nr:EAL domain-containing response regulator [Burkholderiales bacterium]
MAEDHDFQRKTLVRMLRGLGAKTVLEAANGKLALELFRSLAQPVDIIVCDLDMPEMDGMEFIRHLGEAGVLVSLILSSALDRSLIASVETMTRAYGIALLGAVDKPVTPQKLGDLIGKHGKSQVAVKKPPLQQMTEAQIAEGLAAGQFEPFLQPKVALSDGAVTGVEALVRWRHPATGLIPPAAFIPTMEASGMIEDLTWMMLCKSAAIVGQWSKRGLAYTMSVNLSLKSLDDPKLADRITESVRGQGIEPSSIILEVTETAAMTDVARALENLARLRMKGFGLSIDDYGTGYSSMQQLARVPYRTQDRPVFRARRCQPASTARDAGVQHGTGEQARADRGRGRRRNTPGLGPAQATRLPEGAGLLHCQADAGRRIPRLGGRLDARGVMPGR